MKENSNVSTYLNSIGFLAYSTQEGVFVLAQNFRDVKDSVFIQVTPEQVAHYAELYNKKFNTEKA